jgi:hypothetical protein
MLVIDYFIPFREYRHTSGKKRQQQGCVGGSLAQFLPLGDISQYY